MTTEMVDSILEDILLQGCDWSMHIFSERSMLDVASSRRGC